MSHRNNDSNSPWNNRNNPRNNGNDNGRGNWGGNNRYGPDNRFNMNNKDRRNFRGGGYGGGGGRRNFDDRRPYRNNSWNNNNGPDGNYPRYIANWHQKHPDKSGKYVPLKPDIADPMQLQIPPLMIDFSVNTPEEQNQEVQGQPGNDDGANKGATNGNESVTDKDVNESNNSALSRSFGSPEGFQGFAEDDFPKVTNESAKNDLKVLPTKEDKNDMSLQETELRTLIVDEAMKIISDAEQPSCSNATNQSNQSVISCTATVASASTSNPSTSTNTERRASIERSAEQVTRKLINQLTSMSKHTLKQVINNPDSKYETALKTHARQKLRAEVRRQLRNFNLNESTAQTKSGSCGMLEPDECVDSDNIPEALLEQIGKVLDLNLLDMNVTDEVAQTSTVAVEEDECVATSGDGDLSATEVLDKNLQLTDEDGQFDTVDLFARAELLLMKGSESVRQGNSSGPSSPTDEMFPNEQIESIVSEENGTDLADPDQEQIERMLDERLAPNFPCFLRVSTVEELNKKVDDSRPVSKNENEIELAPVAEEQGVQESEIVSSVENIPAEDDNPETILLVEKPPDTHISSPEIIATVIPEAENAVENPLVSTEEKTEEQSIEPVVQPMEVDEVVTPPEAVVDPPGEELSKQETTSNDSTSPKAIPVEQSSSGTIRAPTHPELAARKPKGSNKTYKPNLVQHEHSKKDAGKASTASPSRNSSVTTSSTANSKTNTKSGSSPNLNAVAKQIQHQNSNSNNTTTNGNAADKTTSIGSSSRGRSRGRRETVTSTPSKDNHANLVPASNGSSEVPIKNGPSETISRATVPSSSPISIGTSPSQQQQQSQPQSNHQPYHRSARAKTPGPSLAGGPQDHSSPHGVKKKKKKRNKRKNRSPPPDLAMVLECDLRISRPAVTPTPPPVHSSREPTSLKKTADSERSSSSKPSRETRAKSADPKLYYESKRDRERNKDKDKEKQRNRDDDSKKNRNKDDKKDQDKGRDKQESRDKENKKEKDKEPEAINGTIMSSSGEASKSDRSERRKSPLPQKPIKSSADIVKHSSKEDQKEISKDVVVDKEKELPKETVKESTEIKTEEVVCEKESLLKDKEAGDVLDTSKPSEQSETERNENRITSEVFVENTKPPKTDKKKKRKSLLKGPNLEKGRREVMDEQEINSQQPQKQVDDVVVVIENTPPASVVTSESEEPVQTRSKQKEPPVTSKASMPSFSALVNTAPTEHPTLVSACSVSSLVQRTASPRPWKSPGEKKLIPPAISNMITHHPMSPPSVERIRKTPTPTPPSPVTSPEPPRHHPSTAMPQPEVLTRMPLQSGITPLVAATVAPPVNTFAPIMNMLNQMQEIDNKMSEFQRRKMQIDSEMMRLNSEKFQIDQNSMQLQNERFMLLNTLRAALVECELTTLASMQSISHMPAAATTSPSIQNSNRKRIIQTESELEPRSKRRKENHNQQHQPENVSVVPDQQSYSQVPIPASSSATELLSEPEEPATCTTGVTGAASGERTIRRITKISGNTEILKLFQRRRLISDRSAEESQPEDNSSPQNAPAPAPAPVVVEKAAPAAKRRRTRTYGGNINQNEVTSTVTRLRSDSTRSVESGKSNETVNNPEPVVDTVATSTSAATVTTRLKKDEEIPLAVHRNILPREVKVVVSKLNVASGRRVKDAI